MPWQPWHWAILLSRLASPAWADGARATIAAATRMRMGVMGALDLLEFARRELYRRPAVEKRLPGPGRREVEALPVRDSDLHQLARDLLALDELGDRLQPEAGPDPVDRLDQGVVEVVLGDSLDEQAVDLDSVHREMLQIVERREPAAEVVEVEAHAQGAQRFDLRARALDVGDRRGLGDLEVEALRRHAVLGQLLLHEGDEVGAGERVPGEGDGEFRRSRALAQLRQAAEIEAGALGHPPGDEGA